MKINLLLGIFLIQISFSGYTTPNTGVKWSFDSLVANSSGVVTGTFPTYIVNDTVIISLTDSLCIFPGSMIKIQPKKQITVRGKFSAVGKIDSLITFTRNYVLHADSVWKELRFEESAVDSACMLEYCIVEYSQSGINCVSASPTIEYCEVRYNGLLTGVSSYGIQCFNSNAIIRNTSIYGNKQYGININSTASPVIEYCIIANNNLQNSGFKNQISVGPQGINSPKILYNEIYHDSVNFRVGAVSISAFFTGSGSSAVILGNVIRGNAYGIALLGQNSSIINPLIRNNIITNSTFPDPYLAGSGINCNGIAPAQIIPVITGNLIDGNMWGITIQGSAQPNIGNLSNADSVDDGRNTIINNRNRDTVFALYNNTVNPVFAQNNNWGTNHLDSIATVIFDSTDNPLLGKVTYLPAMPVTSVKQNTGVEPGTFQLMQNFPNPFNPTTTINFRLNSAGFTLLKVYDIVGREVSTLLNEKLNEGTYEIRFDGSTLSDGIYFYQLRSGSFTETKKMLLLK